MLGFGILISLILIAGLTLSLMHQRLSSSDDSLTKRIHRALPGTQCGQCGYPGCRPYAQAIAEGQAEINQCPPGGGAVIVALAELLNRPTVAVNTQFGVEKPAQVAVIEEAQCIGCALCLQACPVDAIVGAPQYMHSVISSDCTGCELCIAPCPVNCIHMTPALTNTTLPVLSHVSHEARLPCIHCNRCSTVCPVQLPAQTLYHEIRQGRRSDAFQLVTQCIECGMCEDNCPSHIPLLDYYRFGKNLHYYHRITAGQARHNRERYENKQRRQRHHAERQQRFWEHTRHSLQARLRPPEPER